MLDKRFGQVTPGAMLSDYFRQDAIRILTVIAALVEDIGGIARAPAEYAGSNGAA